MVVGNGRLRKASVPNNAIVGMTMRFGSLNIVALRESSSILGLNTIDLLLLPGCPEGGVMWG